jgi:hypothetical protein
VSVLVQSEQRTVKRYFEGAPPLRVICGSNWRATPFIEMILIVSRN